MYSNHLLEVPDLAAVLRAAWEMGRGHAEELWEQLVISEEIGHDLKIGALFIVTDGRLFRPAITAADRERGFWATIMATSWDGCQPYDLIAISMEPRGFWLRLGVEQYLGDPAEGPYFTKVLAWLRAGGHGSCYIGGR
jgi:hypothetical protein